ncbi:hypothetical protein B0T25DRAFT_38043 [Lasiosphaeria hispida]|uniref:N-acetyltransferase domain-containing protein n=1 Tax=Lasiosphaeria hispida TaxID=260671 RepID=A0AAJ0HVG6_9PEZI|nr:hypothetical protein B0T25DRAFT_38043 [Lasiosphaeria hispida]
MDESTSLQTTDVVFAEATPEQRQLSWALNGESWAPPLSTSDYLAREEHLSLQELSKDGQCKYWVVYLKGHPRKIIASCESTRKTILISENGVSREGHGYGIASVYTNPAYRRQGIAAMMLHKVQEQMDRDSDCSVLYSDIGRSYYANLGWPVFPSQQAVLSLTKQPDATENSTFSPSQLARARYLSITQLPDLCEVDELFLSARFDGFPADGKTRISFLPSFAQISWQLAREDFMAEKLLGKSPPNKGAIVDNGRSWIYWSHNWRTKKLKVLRIVHVREATAEQRIDDIKVLLEASVAEASAWGMSEVVVWNPDGETTTGSKAVGNTHLDVVKVFFNERTEGSIPSFRWAGGKDVKSTVWEENFYYCWC